MNPGLPLHPTVILLLWITTYFNTSHIFLSYFQATFLSLRRFSTVTAAAKLSTLFKNISKHLHRTIPWVSMVASVDLFRGLVKPLKQWESLIHEVWASTGQSYPCPHVNAADKKKKKKKKKTYVMGFDISYNARLVPVPACECDFHFPAWTRFGCPSYACCFDIKSYPRPPLSAFLLSANIYWVPTTCQTLCQMYRIQWWTWQPWVLFSQVYNASASKN